jgi:hypothetical protein
MFLKARKPSTDPRLRSLLQKAARRGFVSIVERVAARLDAVGDTTWLRSRAVVITFEECWPLGASLSINRDLQSKLQILVRVTTAAKQKDAAGLGALAHAYSEGDMSMEDIVPDPRALKIVAEALRRPQDFFTWVFSQSGSGQRENIVQAAAKYLPVATWQWDKACILAGALLAVGADVPSASPAIVSQVDCEFPYWAALDKHTDEGKAALRDVARRLRTTYRQLIWASFYCESTRVNELLQSPWFEAERAWRFKRSNLTMESASELWSRAQPLVRERLEKEARELEDLVESPLPSEAAPQDTLL